MERDLRSRLAAHSTLITDIQAVSGVPGMSVGCFHNGKIVFTEHFGRRNHVRSDPPDDDSIYYVASLLKILTVAAVAKLVRDGILSWEVPVREYLPDFGERTDDVGTQTTLRDLLSNRTGLAVANFFWGHQHAELLIEKSELLSMLHHIKKVKPFRSTFIYSQWNFILVHMVVEKVTQKPFSRFLEESMITPLGLRNTTFDEPQFRSNNIMSAHTVHNDGTAMEIKVNAWTDDTGITAGAGGKSSLKDLMVVYINLLAAYKHQRDNHVDVTTGSPFTHLKTIFAPHIKTGKQSMEEQSYALGMYRTRLPGNLSIGSWNFPMLRSKLPVFGIGLDGMEILHHTMNFPGFFGSMFLVPQTNSGVVVLANSTPLVDPTDFAAQLLLSELVNNGREAREWDSLGLAKEATKIQLGWFEQLAALVEEGRTDIPPPRPLEMYAGCYTNEGGNFVLQVSATQNGLHLSVQGKPLTTYDLRPYDGDTFYWPVSRETELCEKSMWPVLLPGWHTISFESNRGEAIDHLSWHVDPFCEPEIFVKTRDAIPARL